MNGLFKRLAITGQRNGRLLTLLAVVFFLTFDFIALSLNVWLSYRIESAAININLAGRQRMLSQRMVKSLLVMENSLSDQLLYMESLNELRQTYQQFEHTLDSFHRGGTTLSAEQTEISIEPLDSEVTSAIVREAILEWEPVRQKIRQLLAREYDKELLLQATAIAKEKNIRLLTLMNTLTVELEHETQQEAVSIRFYQGLAFFLALLNFSLAILIYRVRVRRAHDSLDLVDNIMNRIASGILVVDAQGVIIRANQVMAEMCNYQTTELVGKRLESVLFEHDGERFGVRKMGEQFHCQVDVSQVHIGHHPATVHTVVDDSQRVAQQQELTMLAYHDQLTDLPNRHLFNDRLAVEIKHSARRGDKLALLFIDLNRFKEVNDKYGHNFGDLLLGRVATRMKQTVRNSDTVARLGGDEFTLLLADISSYSMCHSLVEKILESICKPYYIQDELIEIGASIGVACFPDDALVEHELLSLADKAMYKSKAQGESCITFASDMINRSD